MGSDERSMARVYMIHHFSIAHPQTVNFYGIDKVGNAGILIKLCYNMKINPFYKTFDNKISYDWQSFPTFQRVQFMRLWRG